MIVLVESLARERATRRASPPARAAGARWGKAAAFDLDPSAEDAEMEERGGVTLNWPAERIETVFVHDLTPVWRKYEIVRIRSSTDDDRTEEATITREMLIPIGTSTQAYVGGGIGYVDDPRQYGAQDRVIHSFVRLLVPSPVPEAEVIDSGVEGAWPPYPQEMFRPGGGLLPVYPIPGDWDR